MPLTNKQIERIMSLHLQDNEKFTPEMKKEIRNSNCIHLFSMNADKDRYNQQKLKSINDDKHPCARMNAMIQGKCTCPTTGGNKKCFDPDMRPNTAFFCRDSMVSIKGRNFLPD